MSVVADWMDQAWLDFVEEISPHTFDADGLKLLKAAWLHGARCAIDKAIAVSKEHADGAPEWTREAPTGPGWYWHRDRLSEHTFKPKVLHVLDDGYIADPDYAMKASEYGGEWWPVKLVQP